MLREHAEDLVHCRDAASPVDRVWGAHALRLLDHGAEAEEVYVRSAGELPAIAPELLVAAARACAASGSPAEQCLAHLPAAMPVEKWRKAEILAARADLELAAGRGADARKDAAGAADAGAPGDVTELVVLRAALLDNDREGARAALRDLRTNWPDAAATAEAERLASEASLVDPVAGYGAADLARRWARWAGHGGATRVSEECGPLVAKLAGPRSELARAQFECGKALATVRHPDAESVLRRAAGEPSLRPAALLAIARVRGRGDNPAAVAEICREIRGPKARDESAECDFLAAFMRLRRGDRAGGRRALEAVSTQHRGHARATDAAWFLAFDLFHDRPADAFGRFDALVAGARDAQEKAQALYWRGRARPAEDSEAARRDWREAAQIDPYGYYGWLAASRAGSAAPPPPEPSDAVVASSRAEPGSPTPAESVKSELAALLLDTGFRREAAAELAERIHPTHADALAWAPFLARAGEFELLVRIGQAQGGPALPFPPPRERRPAIEAAFPLAFPDALAAAPTGVDPHLLLALMRRESRFDPDATSAAQARGLLQLLTKTAAEVAREAHETPPTDEHLYDPQVNVHIAGLYVSRLMERFGHPFLVAAAYNAGPRAAASWVAENPGMELDEWVERIPFRETRAYVKAVAAAYAAYGLLYRGERPKLSLAPVKPVPAGIDY